MQKALTCAVAAGLALAISTNAHAGSIGPLDLSMSVGGLEVWSDTGLGGTYDAAPANFGGVMLNDLHAEWDLQPFIALEFTVANNTAVDQFVVINGSIDIIPDIINTTISGSVGGTTLADFSQGGAGAGAFTGANPLYQAFIDNAVVKTLHDNFVGGPFLTPITAQGFGPEAGPLTADTMKLQFEFWLPPGSNITITSIFNVDGTAVPAPAALALLGVAGLAGRRRRRD